MDMDLITPGDDRHLGTKALCAAAIFINRNALHMTWLPRCRLMADAELTFHQMSKANSAAPRLYFRPAKKSLYLADALVLNHLKTDQFSPRTRIGRITVVVPGTGHGKRPTYHVEWYPGNPSEATTTETIEHKDLYQRVPSRDSCNWKIVWKDSTKFGITIPLFDDKAHMKSSSVVVWGKSASIETHADIAKWMPKVCADLTRGSIFNSTAALMCAATWHRANYKRVEHVGAPLLHPFDEPNTGKIVMYHGFVAGTRLGYNERGKQERCWSTQWIEDSAYEELYKSDITTALRRSRELRLPSQR